jgi:hypothetical protein
MIISHKHKFIFFKSRKTAGSSLQVALAQHRGPNDIITSQYEINDNSHSSGLNMDKFYTTHPHPHLTPTKEFLGPQIWNSYFKFSFIRNPFDIAVSRYHWHLKGKENNLSTSVEGFRNWVKEGNLLKEDSLSLYTCDNNRIELDFIGHYETLQEDIKYIYNYIGLPYNESDLPTLKSGFRDKTHYSKFYDNETKDLVQQFYSEDFKMFNYTFNPDFTVKKPTPIITNHPDKNPNINGPSLIKVPDFIKNKLGDYYLYFASHNGESIKLAYSNNIMGPWTIYEKGTLQLHNTNCKTHIASPDVHIKDNKIVMYYHGDTLNGQYSYKAVSNDGINFTTNNVELGAFYFRVFDYLGETYAIAKNKNIDGIIYKKVNENFEPYFNLIDNIRHTAVYVDNNILYIFYTIVGEAPESLYVCKIIDWEVIDNFKLKEPKYKWEGATQPLIPSSFGMSYNLVNQLRDPAIYEENNDLYLLYSYGGESGIAISKLIKNEN